MIKTIQIGKYNIKLQLDKFEKVDYIYIYLDNKHKDVIKIRKEK